jgi:hypothetical protein
MQVGGIVAPEVARFINLSYVYIMDLFELGSKKKQDAGERHHDH